MKDPAVFRRTVAAVGLVGAVITSAVWTVLEPEFPTDYAERLAAIDEAGTGGAVSAAAFSVSQLFMLAAVLGIAHLIRRGSPAMSNIGASLAVIGVLGHAVFGGSMLMTATMASDQDNRELYADLIEDFESSPFMIFAAAGLIGTVLGVLLLSIGLWRSRVTARWVPATLWAFLVIEFVGTALSDYATYAALACLALAFGELARVVWTSSRLDWEVASAVSGDTDAARRPVAA